MFIGHFGVALAAKKVAPRPSLGTLVLAALLVDGIWPVFLLLGLGEGRDRARHHRGDAAAVRLVSVHAQPRRGPAVGRRSSAASYYLRRRDRVGALWLAALVLSHWVLDFVSHRPDMPLWPGGPLVGLGLWYSVPATLAVEFALFAIGAWLYASVTRPRDRIGTYAFWRVRRDARGDLPGERLRTAAAVGGGRWR